jgi:hypothetical protein
MRNITVKLLVLFIAFTMPLKTLAETSQGCFAGYDASGQPARISLTAERYGDYYEVYGQITTTSFGVFRIKADGWSGAGRMYRRHEGEAGAVYININNFTGSSFQLDVDGYGRFPFRAVSC